MEADAADEYLLRKTEFTMAIQLPALQGGRQPLRFSEALS